MMGHVLLKQIITQFKQLLPVVMIVICKVYLKEKNAASSYFLHMVNIYRVLANYKGMIASKRLNYC